MEAVISIGMVVGILAVSLIALTLLGIATGFIKG